MASGKIDVVRVADKKTHRAFVSFPYSLYRDNPMWVPPLRVSENQRWSPRHNASLRERWTDRFIARRDGSIVGRIAAIEDRAFADRWQPRSGFFGFYECRDDLDASRALFDAAEGALRARGLGCMLGPVNLSTHDEVGLLIDGFSRPPTVLTSYNPRYYEAQVEAAGFHPHVDYYAYRCDPRGGHDAAVERLLRMMESHRTDGGRIRVRSIDPRRWDDEVDILFDLYNRSFAGLWGFVPIGHDEFVERAGEFRRFYRPELALVAELDGIPAGFTLGLPDVNVALAGLGGRLWPIGWLRLARRVPRVRSLRVMLIGVVPECAGRGIAARLSVEIRRAAQRLGMHDSELSLVQSTNRRVTRVIAALEGAHTKTYRLYLKPLT
jgi:GNAT superfamily N-acetyltransferase